MLRSLLESLTRNWVFRRRLPDVVGRAPIYVSGSAGLRYIFRPMDAVDPNLCQLAVEFVDKGDVVWDIGANIGLFAFSAASLSGSEGTVVAFEPDAWLVQLLRRSCALQPTNTATVTVVPAAVASSCDLRMLSLARRSRAANFLQGYGSTQTGGVSEVQTVVSLSLDWIAQRLPPPDLVKIDVEGAEFEVLKGAVDLLRKHRPRILVEVSKQTSGYVSILLKELGYEIFDGELPKANRQPLELAPWSTIALPA